ncbi:plastid-lipid associated protein PAP [Actinidia rufa]|uniref:Plastid-lipid associated protein PAP n=1 Tax=Actinidia rufa TaxID=165716 RepID=A0A7J0E8F3_9ERIC|nr:plastid-lipid associated protein PAP [Actinidia rufa]
MDVGIVGRTTGSEERDGTTDLSESQALVSEENRKRGRGQGRGHHKGTRKGQWRSQARGRLLASKDGKSDWVLDSGSTYHLCKDREVFSTYAACEGRIWMTNNTASRVVGKRSVRFRMVDGRSVMLTEVRHVPNLRKNLISIGMLDSKGYSFDASGGTLRVFKGKQGDVVGKEGWRLYRLEGSVQTRGGYLEDPERYKSAGRCFGICTEVWLDTSGATSEGCPKKAQRKETKSILRSWRRDGATTTPKVTYFAEHLGEKVQTLQCGGAYTSVGSRVPVDEARGLTASEDDLQQADAAAKKLEAVVGPVDLSVDLDKLQGRWKLIYSSAFSSRILGGSRPGPPTGRLLPITLGQVFQRIDILSNDFDNIVELELGTPWPFPPVEVTATLAHKFELIGSCKVKIVFEKTTVKTRGNLSQLPPLEIPRIPDNLRPPSNTGSGEFEVTYMDSDTRMTRGDRDHFLGNPKQCLKIELQSSISPCFGRKFEFFSSVFLQKAPTPSAKPNQMAHTPSSKPNQSQLAHSKTPQSKHRLNFNLTKPSPNPNSTAKENLQSDHPVEVIGRIRNYPDRKEKPISALQINPDRQSLRIRTDIGYRDFSLDGISLSEEEDLDGFYKKFVQSRIREVRLGNKCTIMMYGPTGSGKSHTMFGCAKQQGIVYRSLKDILDEGDGENLGSDQSGVGIGTFVQVTVLEIYNEEIYDLLSTNNGGGFGFGWSKGSASKVKLEVMGKKAKNATFISGNEATKISKEIQKIILDVPTWEDGLCLLTWRVLKISSKLVKMTAKINQGNIALKRVVESIANGDSHVPFRDSKLTMLLQPRSEGDAQDNHYSGIRSKSEMHCARPHTPAKNVTEDSSSAVILGSRITAMDQFIFKLQMENKLREKERNEAHEELMKKEEEIAALRAKLVKAGTSEEEINLKVNERTQMLKRELEKKIQECEKMAHEFVELERRKMEETILQQQREAEILRRRLEEIELDLCHSRDRNGEDSGPRDMDGSSFAEKLLEIYANEDPGMEKSMDLDKSIDLDVGRHVPSIRDIKDLDSGAHSTSKNSSLSIWEPEISNVLNDEEDDAFASTCTNKVCLSTVFEEGEEVEEQEEEDKEKSVDEEEVQKEVIEEKTVYSTRMVNASSPMLNFNSGSFTTSPQNKQNLDYFREWAEEKDVGSEPENATDSASSRRSRIQNIFTLCGNYRELSQHGTTPDLVEKGFGSFDPHSSLVRTTGEDSDERAVDSKENYNSLEMRNDDLVEVYVKWEVSKDHQGKFITTLKVVKDATLSDLRKLIEIRLGSEKQAFTFLALGDPTGAPVAIEKELTVLASKLPICNQLRGHLACLRPATGIQGPSHHLPCSPLQNILNITGR